MQLTVYELINAVVKIRLMYIQDKYNDEGYEADNSYSLKCRSSMTTHNY